MKLKHKIALLALLLLSGCLSETQEPAKTTTAVTNRNTALNNTIYKCTDCNIILLTVETFRADHVTSLGYGRNTTPRLDEFGRENIIFENAFVQAPWTLPSLASILTSQYPSEHGVTAPETILDDRLRTMSDILKENGYYTFYNFNAWFPLEELGYGQGFDKRGPGGRAEGMTSAILKQIKEHKDEKFFIWNHFNEPHQPYNPSAGYDDLFIKNIPPEYKLTSRASCKDKKYTQQELEYLQALYDGEIKFADEHIGALIDGLKQMGVYNKTVIVVIGDHGEEFQEHGGCDHGRTQYEEVIHVPLFMRIPAVSGGVRLPQQVMEIDILPTVLDVLGIPGEKTSGSSLMPMIYGVEKQDRIVYAEGVHPSYGPELKAVRYKNHKLTYQPPKAKTPEVWRLYDLQSDPRELRDIYDLDSEIKSELKEILSNFASGNRTKHATKTINYTGDMQKKLRDIGYIN